ncbi:hypothetical protein H072_9161 [Dactylellina haptotyla CBS 200.50]|uniref:Apple domain-containing protein n=1 Tax=Dactylellina haptotyla (strain CBS 200.50) TaxID=1284197 RepID=S8BPM3_DACHA|nr:hypothetical protein H072_9161 [Dactylellina haptotyla CBS 200.50]
MKVTPILGLAIAFLGNSASTIAETDLRKRELIYSGNPARPNWSSQNINDKAFVPANAVSPSDPALLPIYITSVYVKAPDPLLSAQTFQPSGPCGRKKCNFINLYTLTRKYSLSKYVCAFFQTEVNARAATVGTMTFGFAQYKVKGSLGISRRFSPPVNSGCWIEYGRTALSAIPYIPGINPIPKDLPVSSASISTSRTSATTSSMGTSTSSINPNPTSASTVTTNKISSNSSNISPTNTESPGSTSTTANKDATTSKASTVDETTPAFSDTTSRETETTPPTLSNSSDSTISTSVAETSRLFGSSTVSSTESGITSGTTSGTESSTASSTGPSTSVIQPETSATIIQTSTGDGSSGTSNNTEPSPTSSSSASKFATSSTDTSAAQSQPDSRTNSDSVANPTTSSLTSNVESTSTTSADSSLQSTSPSGSSDIVSSSSLSSTISTTSDISINESSLFTTPDASDSSSFTSTSLASSSSSSSRTDVSSSSSPSSAASTTSDMNTSEPSSFTITRSTSISSNLNSTESSSSPLSTISSTVEFNTVSQSDSTADSSSENASNTSTVLTASNSTPNTDSDQHSSTVASESSLGSIPSSAASTTIVITTSSGSDSQSTTSNSDQGDITTSDSISDTKSPTTADSSFTSAPVSSSLTESTTSKDLDTTAESSPISSTESSIIFSTSSDNFSSSTTTITSSSVVESNSSISTSESATSPTNTASSSTDTSGSTTGSTSDVTSSATSQTTDGSSDITAISSNETTNTDSTTEETSATSTEKTSQDSTTDITGSFSGITTSPGEVDSTSITESATTNTESTPTTSKSNTVTTASSPVTDSSTTIESSNSGDSSIISGTTASPEETSTTTTTLVETPSATPGGDFDIQLDQQIGYMVPDTEAYYQQLFPGIDLSENNNTTATARLLRRLTSLFSDVNHRKERRWSFSKLVKAVVKAVVTVVAAPIIAVVKVVVALLPPVDKSFDFGIPFKLSAIDWLPSGVLVDPGDGLPLLKTEVPENLVDQYLKKNNILKDRVYVSRGITFKTGIGAELGLYCKDCYVDTKFDVSGHIAWDSNGMKALSLGYSGPMTFNLGLNLKAEGFYNPVLTKELKKFDLTAWKIPLILSIGPRVAFTVGWEVDLRGYVSLQPTFTLNWKNYGAIIVIVGSSPPTSSIPTNATMKFAIEAGASLATNLYLEAAITSGVDITAIGDASAGVYIRTGMGFGLAVKQQWGAPSNDTEEEDPDECIGIALNRQWYVNMDIKAAATAKPLGLGFGNNIPLYKTTKTLQPSTCFPWSKPTSSSTVTDASTSSSTTTTSSSTATSASCVPTVNPQAKSSPSCQSQNGTLIHGSDDEWYQVVCGTDFTAPDIEVNSLTTLGDCLDRCTTMNTQAGSAVCGGVTFIPGFLNTCSACRLKGTISWDKSVIRLYAVESVRRINKPVNNPSCDINTPYKSASIGSNTGIYQQNCGWYVDDSSSSNLLQQLNGVTYSSCLDTCTTTAGCKGVSFMPVNGYCWLLNGIDSHDMYQDPDPSWGSITALVSDQPLNTANTACDYHTAIDKSYMPLQNSSNPKQFFVDCNTQFWLNDYATHKDVPTIQACVEFCSQEERCVAATWYKFGGGDNCFMKERWDIRDWHDGQTGGNSFTGAWDSALLSTYQPF